MSKEIITGRYHGLDALRGAAAFSIVLSHIALRVPSLTWMAQNAYLSVDFFFLLSGFVIAQAYEPRLRAGLSFGDFALLRAVRLYPLIVLGVGIGALKYLILLLIGWTTGPTAGWLAVFTVANALVLPAPYGESLFPLNPPEWSLFTEIVVNLLFAAVLFKARWQVLLAVSVTAFVALAVKATVTTESTPTAGGWAIHNVDVGFYRTICSFFLGAVLFRLGCGRVRTRSAWVLPVVGAAFVTILMLPISRWNVLLSLVMIAIVFPAILWIAAAKEPPRALTTVAARLGDISFPLYALHYPILILYAAGARRLEGHPVPYTIAYIALVTVAANFASVYYDAPVRSWFSRRLGRRESAKPASFAGA